MKRRDNIEDHYFSDDEILSYDAEPSWREWLGRHRARLIAAALLVIGLFLYGAVRFAETHPQYFLGF